MQNGFVVVREPCVILRCTLCMPGRCWCSVAHDRHFLELFELLFHQFFLHLGV